MVGKTTSSFIQSGGVYCQAEKRKFGHIGSLRYAPRGKMNSDRLSRLSPASNIISMQYLYQRLAHPMARFLPWFSATFVALLAALSILQPKLGAALIALAFIIWCTTKIISRPVLAISVALWIFPWYNLFRAALWCYYPELPLFASRFWMEILMSLAFLGVLTRFVLRRTDIVLDRDDIPFFIVLLGGLYALIIAAVDHRYFTAVFGVYYSLTPVLCFFALRWCGSARSHMRQSLMTLFASFILIALLSLADYFTHPDFMLRIYQVGRGTFFQGSVDELRHTMMTSYLRMQSLMLEENQWGALCAFIGLFCVARLAAAQMALRTRIAVLSLLCLSMGCLVLSMSRGAALGFTAGLLVMALLHRGSRVRVLLIAFGILFTLGGLYGIARMDSRVKLIETRFIKATSHQGQSSSLGASLKLDPEREYQWTETIDTFVRTPSGIGLGSSGYAALYTGVGRPLTADGIFLRVLVEQGIPGAMLWAVGILAIAGSLRRRLQWSLRAGDPLLTSVGIALLAELVCLCVHGFSANTFDYAGATPLFFLFSSLFLTATDRLGFQERL